MFPPEHGPRVRANARSRGREGSRYRPTAYSGAPDRLEYREATRPKRVYLPSPWSMTSLKHGFFTKRIPSNQLGRHAAHLGGKTSKPFVDRLSFASHSGAPDTQPAAQL